MKKIYNFHWDCGRQGDVVSLFIANEKDVEAAMGKNIEFGEILGKHSDVSGTLEERDISVRTDDQDFIKKFEEIMGTGTISGHNPLENIYGEYEEDDDEEEE